MLGLYLRFHARFFHATLIDVMLNFWKVEVAPTTPLYTKTPPLLTTLANPNVAPLRLFRQLQSTDLSTD